jgi:nicotinamidase/pyrazinamidase
MPVWATLLGVTPNIPELECLLWVDPQKTFEDKKLNELPVGWAVEIVPVINAEIQRVKEKAWIVIFSGDAHDLGHFSLASSYIGINPFTLLTLDIIDTIKLSPQAKFTKEELKIELQKSPQMAWPDHGLKDTKWWEYIDGLNTEAIDYHIEKGFVPNEECYSAFGGVEKERREPLLNLLKRLGVTTITVVWLALDYCVKASTIDAAKNWFKVILKLSGTKAVDSSREIEVLAELRALWVQIVD